LSSRPAASRLVVPGDVALFLVAFGVVPLVLAILSPHESQRGTVEPLSFAQVPTWSITQVVAFVLAGGLLGWSATRLARGLAAVGLGIVLGLAVDLWWFAGWVERSGPSTLPEGEWLASLAASALILVGALYAGFALSAVARRLTRGGRSLGSPTKPDLVAAAVALVAVPLLALTVAAAAASSPLVAPRGGQIQTVRVSAGAIDVEPAALRAGPTRFRCEFGSDAILSSSANLFPISEGTDVNAVSPLSEESASSCGPQIGTSWGTAAVLEPGRYVWMQFDFARDVPAVAGLSQVVVVTP